MFDNLGKKALYSSALAAILVLGGCSSSDGGSSSGGGVITSTSSGLVVDGYIAGGHLYADLDGSATETIGDINTTTDAQGNFSFGDAEIPYGTYLYLTGGTDIATDTAFTGMLSASFEGNNTVVSPVSSMVVAIMQNGGEDYETAVASASTMLGLTPEQVEADPYTDPEVFIASQRVVSAASLMGTPTAESFSEVVAALAASDMNITAAATDLGVSPDDALAVDDYITALLPLISETATVDELEAYQVIVTDAVDDPTNLPDVDLAASVANALGCVTFDAIKGSNAEESNITTDLVLGGCENVDDNVTFSWSSDNAAVLTEAGVVVRPDYTGGDVNLSLTVASDVNSSVSSQKSFYLSIPRLDNRLPTAVADVNTTTEETPVSFNVLANDSDPDGDLLTLVAVSNGVAFTPDGTVTYTPAIDFNGDFVFSYTVRDSWNGESNATVTVTVTAFNDAPVLAAVADQTLAEDFGTASIEINATDVDTDAASLVYSVVGNSNPVVGASFTGSLLTFTSVPDLFGDTNITVMVSDGDKNDTAAFTVYVTPVDDAPVIAPIADPAAVDEDAAAFAVDINATDVDSVLTLGAGSSDTAIATAVISGSSVVVTPQPDAFGTVTITVSADDGVNAVVTETFSVTINPVDDAPVLADLAPVSVDEDSGAYTVTASATDVDNDDAAIVYALVSSSDTAVATVSGMDVTPVADAFGTADINVTATSNGVTVSKILVFTVNPVDDAPVLAPIAPITVNEDNGTISVAPSATDVDNNDSEITYGLVSSDPSVVAVSNGELSTVQDANGIVTITVTAYSGALTDTTDFNVTVTAVNDAPTADDFTVPVVTDSTGNTIDLSTHIGDVDGDALSILSFDVIDGLTLAGPTSFNYDNNGTEGTITFNYTVEDPDGLTASGIVSLNVSAEPVIPVANDDTAATDEEVAVNIEVLANDVNVSSISAAWVVTPENGTVQVETNNTITFTPALDKSGSFLVRYTGVSVTGHEDNATVTVTVNDINDAPVVAYVTPVPLYLTESTSDQLVRVDLNISDVDTDLASVLIIGASSDNPAITIQAYSPTYVDVSVPAYANGEANLTFTVSDGQDTTVETFQAYVAAVDSTPYITTTETWVDINNGAAAYGLSVAPYNESFTLSLTDAGDAGIAFVSLNADGVTLDITPVAPGTTKVTVHAVNDANASLFSDTNVTVNVYDSTNVAPVAYDGNNTVVTDDIVYGVLNVYDEGGPLTFTVVTPPAHGAIIGVDEWGNYLYASTNAYIGEDSFTFQVTDDGSLTSNIATVTITVTAATNSDSDGDLTEIPITLAEFNAYTALTAYGMPMYSVWEEGWSGESNLSSERLVINELPQEVEIFHIETNTTQILPYTLDTDNATIIVDFDGDAADDFKAKYVGTASKEELELELNLTLPADANGYKLATLELQDTYDLWSEPEYADWNCTTEPCVGSNPYYTLGDYMADKSYDPNVPSWQTMWIDGYEFKFAEGSTLADVNGTIIRTAVYWDGAAQAEYVTNANAGTWEFTQTPGGEDVLIVTPSVYGITTARIYMVSTDDTLVHAGEFIPANTAHLEYKFDENTMYYIGNSIMNRTASLPSESLVDASGEFISFNSLATAPLVTDGWMTAVWAYYDSMNGYTLNTHGLYFDSNGSLYMSDSQDGDSNMTYQVSNDIITIDGVGIEGKVTEVITSAVEISAMTGVPDTVLPASPVAYRFAHLDPNANLDLWGDTVYDLSGFVTYSTFTDFQTAFMSGQVALDYTPSGGIGYAGGIAGVGGTLAEYDYSMNVITPNAGTWEIVDFEGQPVMVFDITVQRNGDHNAIAFDSSISLVGRGRYSPPDSGSVELRYNDETTAAIVSYLQDQNTTYGNPIDYEIETRILRDVEAVPFTNNMMYEAWVEVNATNCERNVTTEYVWLDGTSTSGNFVLSGDPESYTYASSDGMLATVTQTSIASEVFMVKVNEELNATQLTQETGLFLPATAYGYRITYMDIASGQGGTMVRLDGTTIGFLQSYLNNNASLTTMCMP